MANDVMGRELKVGQVVVRVKPGGQGYTANLEILQVSRIDNNKIWLGDSQNPMQFPGRLAIVTDVK